MSAKARRQENGAPPANAGPLQPPGIHRVVPVSLELDEISPGPQWRCSACHARRSFPDDFDDFECVARPLFYEANT